MFVDTKNFVAEAAWLQRPDEGRAASCAVQAKAEKGTRRVWQPLLRLVSRRSAATANCSGDASKHHPNNVNLNNAPAAARLQPPPPSQPDAGANIQRVVAASKPAHKDERSARPTTPLAADGADTAPNCQCEHSDELEEVAVIGSASARIEKHSSNSSSSQAGGGCAYGRNCSHEHHRHSDLAAPVIALDALQLELASHDCALAWLTASQPLLHAWLLQQGSNSCVWQHLAASPTAALV